MLLDLVLRRQEVGEKDSKASQGVEEGKRIRLIQSENLRAKKVLDSKRSS